MAIYSPSGDVDSNGAEEVNLRTSAGVELLGQKASTASLPVVIASDQSVVNTKITDGTDILAVNSDGSLNVALSGGGDTTQTGTFTASTQTITINTNGKSTVKLKVSGVFSGLILFFGSVDGSTLQVIRGFDYATSTFGVGTNTTGVFELRCGGFANITLLSSSWISGTANIYLTASDGLGVYPTSIVGSPITPYYLAINSDGSLNAQITVPGVVKTVQITYNPPTIGDQATAVVAAIVGKKIRVYSLTVSLGISSSNIFLRNGTGGIQLSVLFLRTTGGSIPSFYYQEATFGTFLFETGINTALVCNSSTTTGPVSIQVVYSEV